MWRTFKITERKIVPGKSYQIDTCVYEDGNTYEEMPENTIIAETATSNFRAHQWSSRSQNSLTYLSSQCNDTKAPPTAKRYSYKKQLV